MPTAVSENYMLASAAFASEENWVEIASPVSSEDEKFEKMRRVSEYIDHELWEPAQKFRAKYDKNWKKFYEFYKGKQWPTFKRSWQACLVINMVFATIEAVVSTMSDNKPKINLLPSDPSQETYVETISALIDTVWRRRGVLYAIQDALRAALIYGVGFVKVFWNPNLEGGLGDIDVSTPSPWSIWVEPYCKSIEDSSFVIQGDYVSLDYVRRMYPENAKYVRPGMGAPKSRKQTKGGTIDFQEDPALWITPMTGSQILADITDTRREDSRLDQKGNSQQCFLVECWFLDDEVEEEPEEVVAVMPESEGGTVERVRQVTSRPKYPFGRVVTKVGNVVLRDMPAPYKMYDWPYVLFRDNVDPEEPFYGFGEVELLKDPQRELNKRRSQIADNITLMGNGFWIVDTNSRVDRDKLSNRPGLVVTKQPGSEVRREAPIALPSHLFENINMIMKDMQNLTGVGDVLGGIVPRGIRSGAGLSEAQDIAATRVRLKVKHMERSISEIGKLMIKLVKQYYTVPRVISILGANGSVQWVNFDGSKISGDWDIIIGCGSTLPVSKSLRFEQAVRLYQLQAIDRRALLEAADFPNREDILKRLGDDQGAGGDQVPTRSLQPPPKKTDNSRSRMTGRSMLADTGVSQGAAPGGSATFNSPPSGP